MNKKLSILVTGILFCSAVFANGTGEASGTSRQKLQQINVAYMPNYASAGLLMAGIKAGFFEEQGLKPNLVEFADGPTEISAMESGSISIAYIGSGAHKLCINGRAKIFAMDHKETCLAIIGLKSHGVRSIKDLKGKRVAYSSGTSSERILSWALADAGMTAKDIIPMEMDASGIVSAMTSSGLAACAAWSPHTTTILETLSGDAVVLKNDEDFSDRIAPMTSFVCMAGYAEKNRDLLVRFSRALNKARDYRISNVEQTCKWVAEQLGCDYNVVYKQRNDGKWLTNGEYTKEINDGYPVCFVRTAEEKLWRSGKSEC